MIARMVPASTGLHPWASVTESYTSLPPVKRIVVAMKFPTGHYDNDQSSVLQVAHSLACKELCINETDQVSRERVAAMIDGVCEIRPY